MAVKDKPVRSYFGKGGLFMLDNLKQLPANLTAEEARLMRQTAIRWDKMGSKGKKPAKDNSWLLLVDRKIAELRSRRLTQRRQLVAAAKRGPMRIRLGKYHQN